MIKDKLKTDDAIIKQLDLKRISRLICNTDKGILELTIRKGESTYFLTLDSVPLNKEDNKILMDLLFPAPIPQVVPQVQKEPVKQEVVEQILKETTNPARINALKEVIKENGIAPKKKGGRPKGSVNKQKNPETNGPVN